MKEQQRALQELITNEFMTKCNVSKEEAISDMNVIMISYANTAGIPLIDFPVSHLERLKEIFIDEIQRAVLANYQNHVDFVKSISINLSIRGLLHS